MDVAFFPLIMCYIVVKHLYQSGMKTRSFKQEFQIELA